MKRHRDHDLCERLRRAGCPVSPPKKSDLVAEMFPLTSPLGESTIYQLGYFEAWVAIRACKRFRLGTVELDTPFLCDPEWLKPEKQQYLKREWEKKSPLQHYQIPIQGRSFPYHAVLNHHFQQHKRLERGDRLEGVLLLEDADHPIPQEFCRNQQLTISLYDTLGEAVASCLVNFLFLAPPQRRMRPTVSKPDGGLFGHDILAFPQPSEPAVEPKKPFVVGGSGPVGPGVADISPGRCANKADGE